LQELAHDVALALMGNTAKILASVGRTSEKTVWWWEFQPVWCELLRRSLQLRFDNL